MVRNQSRKTYWQHLSKLANSKTELEKINEQIQYYASLGVHDYFLNYNTKKEGKSLKQVRPMLESKGFTLIDENSGIKGQSVLHISWNNATEDYAKTLFMISNHKYKMRKLQEKIYPKVEEAANKGEYTLTYDLSKAGIGELTDEQVSEIKESIADFNDFSSISTSGTNLILEWRI